jgi:hypothetical protein
MPAQQRKRAMAAKKPERHNRNQRIFTKSWPTKSFSTAE